MTGICEKSYAQVKSRFAVSTTMRIVEQFPAALMSPYPTNKDARSYRAIIQIPNFISIAISLQIQMSFGSLSSY
jgi:hypothetical protein